MKDRKILICGHDAGIDIKRKVEEMVKQHDADVVIVSPEEFESQKQSYFPIYPYYEETALRQSLAMVNESTIAPGGPRRIIRHYNPETDKQPDRNSQCKCGSGKKFKKCCINKQK